MRNITFHDAGVGVLAATLVFVVLFWRLGTPTFWDPDEAHYAETSREIVATGDWWAPHYNEQPFFDKPVLFHQLQAMAMRAIADPELGARIVPALASLGLIALTYWFAATLISRDVARVAALMLTASPGVFALSRYAILDTLFTLFTFGGAATLAVAALRDTHRRLEWAGYLALALGVMVKGPLALVLAALTMLVLIAASPDVRRRLLGLHWIAGLLFIVVVSSGSFVYMYLRFGQRFVDGYVLDENLRLFAASRFANQPGFWFYFQILATGLLPWTGLLIGRMVDDVRSVWRGERVDHVEAMLWAWTLTIVSFFTASTFKLDHYVFPAAPALCVLCARAWIDVRTHHRESSTAASRLGLYLIGPFLVAFGLGCGYFLIARLALPAAAMSVPIALTLAGATLTALANVRGALPPRIPWVVISALAVTYAGIILFVLPALEQRKVVPGMAQWVAAHARQTDRLCSFRMNRWAPAYRFYVGRHVEMLEEPTEADAFFTRPEPFFCVMRQNAYEEFVARGAKLRVLIEREGMTVTTGRALFRTPQPPAKYVVVTKAW
jgi:4-amino-4-deoxy-L-arabinose transferase-like glycosyltransferase